MIQLRKTETRDILLAGLKHFACQGYALLVQRQQMQESIQDFSPELHMFMGIKFQQL